jgi:glyoxylase-like metal-dependent hydrolase (beta-lactamase superfamily II)
VAEIGGRHYRFVEVARGVHAAIATPGGGGVGNAGIVDLGASTAVFDTSLTPQAARELREAAMWFTGRAATLVVNSHWHGDHVHGNSIFPGATIIAAKGTAELIRTSGAERLQAMLEDDPVAYLADLARAVADAPDPGEQARRQEELNAANELVDGLPLVELVLPSQEVQGPWSLPGDRRAQVIPVGVAHTASDAVLAINVAGVVFAGAVVVIGNQPMAV